VRACVRARAVFLLVNEIISRVQTLALQASQLDAALASALDALAPPEPLRRPSSAAEAAPRPIRPHLEPLLEGYLDHVRAARQLLAAMQRRIEEDASCANLLLDRIRNRLIKFDVAASTVAAATGLGSCAAGIFGMNLPAAILSDEGSVAAKPYYGWLFEVVASAIAGSVALIIIVMLSLLFGRSIYVACRKKCDRRPLNNGSANGQNRGSGSVRGVAAVRAEQANRDQRWKERFAGISSVRFPEKAMSREVSLRLTDGGGGSHEASHIELPDGPRSGNGASGADSAGGRYENSAAAI